MKYKKRFVLLFVFSGGEIILNNITNISCSVPTLNIPFVCTAVNPFSEAIRDRLLIVFERFILSMSKHPIYIWLGPSVCESIKVCESIREFCILFLVCNNGITDLAITLSVFNPKILSYAIPNCLDRWKCHICRVAMLPKCVCIEQVYTCPYLL